MKVFSLKARAAACAVLSAVLLAACGSGGGTEDLDPIAVTFSPSTIEQSYTQHFDRTYYDAQSPESVKLIVTFASPPPSDVVVVRVLMSEPVFGTAPISFSPVGNSTTQFEARVEPDQMLGPGVHEGDVVLELCRDTSCSRIVPTTGSLRYRLDVRAGLRVKMTVNGVEQVNPGGAVPGTSGTMMSVDLASGARADFSSTIPVTWSYGSSSWSYPCRLLEEVSVQPSNESPTSLSVTIDNQGSMKCDLLLIATPLDTSLGTASYLLEVVNR